MSVYDQGLRKSAEIIGARPNCAIHLSSCRPRPRIMSFSASGINRPS